MMFARLVLLMTIAALPVAARAARSEWSSADEAQLRVLLNPGAGGKLEGGIEIVLEPGWYTYWRNPGEAGVPPVFDFAGSENVGELQVLYPAPVRKVDGGSTSLIYEDEVVFPLLITPHEAGRPVVLRLKAQFGVCSEICIPTQAGAEVALFPDAAADPLSAVRLRSFAERVPKGPVAGRFDIEKVVADGDSLDIDIRMPDSSYTDLFVDPPKDWYIGQPVFVGRVDGLSRYRLSLAGRPSGMSLKGQQFRFVAVAGGEAIEESVELP
jgi:DsbC/DsbD-like thiol-disulfide interchange protein